MAVIEGQIEPLKKLKEILHQNGITRFSSIGEINDFIKNYEIEKNEIPTAVKNELNSEIKELRIELIKYQKNYDDLKADITDEINNKIKTLDEELELTKESSNKSLIHRIFCYPKTKRLFSKKSNLQKNFEKIILRKTDSAEQDVRSIKIKLDDYTANIDVHASERCRQLSQKLDNTKEVIDSLYSLIAGAIGENSVIKEIQKLPDNFHLFNDFSLEFDPPIYNKKEGDRIYSIQIDHLLICESGIFVLETKNWGEQSVKNSDLRSPVKQILRSSYALYVLLNSQSKYINLDSHHWGSKQIPVRNLIVMTNAKPREEFKHVKVLSLKELNRYVTYFDPIFSSEEVESICNYLRMKTLPLHPI